MLNFQANPLKKFYLISISLFILQVGTLLMLHTYANELISKNKSILDQTTSLLTEAVPSIQYDLTQVSRKTSDIKMDVMGLRNGLTAVDHKLTEVGRNVEGVGKELGDFSSTAGQFINGKSGLVWGHSLNPYILLALLGFVAVSIPVLAWALYRRRISPEPLHEGLSDAAFAKTLENLSEIVEKLRTEEVKGKKDPDLKRIMEETERLINDARHELGLHNAAPIDYDEPERPRILH